ncbi:hypothetical protein BRADI_1g05206v3 [Brachypodium distachyon]|uniref:Uncharacterized protein n=2 Tax=Brachypodium distachyon TaxID=15368 RepID=A0A0Q3N7M7_BRADI|nr:hypothetical protein BRADI_1g05206v3 [Brachypodium distachyon]
MTVDVVKRSISRSEQGRAPSQLSPTRPRLPPDHSPSLSPAISLPCNLSLSLSLSATSLDPYTLRRAGQRATSGTPEQAARQRSKVAPSSPETLPSRSPPLSVPIYLRSRSRRPAAASARQGRYCSGRQDPWMAPASPPSNSHPAAVAPSIDCRITAQPLSQACPGSPLLKTCITAVASVAACPASSTPSQPGPGFLAVHPITNLIDLKRRLGLAAVVSDTSILQYQRAMLITVC